MNEIPALIQDLALILVVAGVVTLLFKKLKQPLVLGYIVAGFLVSPHMPYTMSVVDKADIHTWADIGVMFLLFSLGLDFSFKKILKMGAAPAIAALTIVFGMILTGICIGKIFGWTQINCLFLGGMLAMSSTTIIYKAFDDLGLRQQKFASLVMSVLILEDILAIVLMVMLSAFAGNGTPNGTQLLGTVMNIGYILILWFIIGLFIIPTFLRRVRSLMNSETMLIVSLGLCCLMAVISVKCGFSSAFGAFVMGSILAETVEAEKIERLTEPVKNLFGAIFFVSVGMLVDPAILVEYALPTIVIILAVIAGQATVGTLGYLLSGQSLKTAMRCSFSMAQIGEFAFIIASLGLSLGVISDFLYPVVVAVSVITTFLTPYMIRESVPAYAWVEKRLPRTWVQWLNRAAVETPDNGQSHGTWHRLLTQMAANTLIYGIVCMAIVALMLTFFLPFIRSILPHWWANTVCGTATVLLMSPFLRALVMKKNKSEEFKTLWLQNRHNRLPLIFTILVRVVIAMAFIFYVCNYLSRFSNAIMICLALIIVICMILSRQLQKRSIMIERLFIRNLHSRDIAAQVSGKRKPLFAGRLLDHNVHISQITIPEDSLWAGKALKDLRLSNRFGVHASSIHRGQRVINIPSGDDIIFPGDRLSVIGSDNQLNVLNQAVQQELHHVDPDIEQHEMKLDRLIITPTSPFLNKTLSESGIRDTYNCMVVGLEDAPDSLTNITPDYRFQLGDVLWIVGETHDQKRIKESKHTL